MKNTLRFDPDILRQMAGDKMFARGQAYFRDGQVRLLAIGPNRVTAHVAGTENYHITLTGSGERIGGECTCRAFEDRGFCKHMVASALAANAADQSPAMEEMPLARVRAYLATQGAEALVDLVMECAERDDSLFRRLEIGAIASTGDGVALEKELAKAIDEATRARGFIDYAEAGSWAMGVDATLDVLEPLAGGALAAVAGKLAIRALDRVTRALGNIDDSDGHCGALMNRARDIHLAACRTACPQPIGLARELFAREMADDFGVFAEAAAHYQDILGEAGLAEYRRLAEEAWSKLPPRRPAVRRQTALESEHDYSRLLGILDYFAERDSDVDARIALRVKALSSAWDYCQLAELCREAGRANEALRYAEEGLWLFEDERQDFQLVNLAADLLIEQGRGQEAMERLWHSFEKRPDIALYERLRALAGSDADDRAVALLQEKLVKGEPNPWNGTSDLLISILLRAGGHAAAWVVLRRHGASRGMQETLAKASEKTHMQDALAVYMSRVEELVSMGGDGNYQAAAQFIRRIGALQDRTTHSAWLAAVKQRHCRRRNFLKLL